MFVAALAVLGSIVSLCIGSTYAKHLFSELGPGGSTVYRVGFAAILLLAFWRPWRFAMDTRQKKLILIYGLTLGIMNYMFYQGISRIPIGVAIAIEFIGPLALAIFSSRRLIDFVWISLAAIGMFLLSPFAGKGAGDLDPVGVAYILGAAVAWTIYIIVGKKAGDGHGGQVVTYGLLIGALVTLPFGGAEALTALSKPFLLWSGLLVAVLSSAIPYSLEMYALKRMPQETFGILLSMEPAVGALTGLFMIGEVLSPLQWTAIACIVAASVGTTVSIKKELAVL